MERIGPKLAALLICAVPVVCAWQLGATAEGSATVSGVVVDADGPVAEASVRIRNTANATLTDTDGHFLLGSLVEGQRTEVTAWFDGYYIASAYITPPVEGITITLRPYHTTDNPDYAWPSPIAGTSSGACGNCHPMIIPQWITNAHGSAVSNARFYSLYNGTDLSGTAQIGPGYVLDFPGTSGNCANCHAPGAAVDGYLTTNMNDVRDVITGGIHCDFCHKVGGAYLDPATGSVYANVPGVRGMRVLRPPEGDNIFIGPFDDIHDPDTYLPLFHESQFCAACHQFSFWGTPIYESYNEWLASPYADAGVTCQSCHMLPTGDTLYALPEVGGLEHSPESIPSHLQLGAFSAQLLQNTVDMTVTAESLAGQVRVSVTITNTQAGHHVPTDFPGRHMILTVVAQDAQGRPLSQRGGPTVPTWGGAEAGLPGKAYAKVLKDAATGEAPVVSYWKQALIEGDNRIPALGVDRSVYLFDVHDGASTVDVDVTLSFRRAFQDVMDEKGWETPDILMESASLAVATPGLWRVSLPLTSTSP